MQLSLAPRTYPLPAWLPEPVRARLSGQPVSFELPKAIKLRLRSPEKIRVSEWTEKYRMVADGAHVGPWRHEYAPHTVKIMDTFGLPHVREVWFCGVEQSGKTNTMINCLAWSVDCSPGNIFYLMPTEDTAAKIVGSKIRPVFNQSPRLAKYLTGRQDDNSNARIIFRHGMTFFPAWANSPSSMATFPAKTCFSDETDKFPEMAGKEASPIALIKKRNRNYKGIYKRFFASTPAGRFIQNGVKKCHQVWEFRVCCPDCSTLIRMDDDHLHLPEDATADNVDRLQVGYACNHCGVIWDDQIREQAIRKGRWFCVQGEELPRPAKVGFLHRAWECLDISLAEIAAAWLAAKDGDRAEKTAWANGYEAKDYEPEKVSTIDVARVLKFKSDIPRDLVPPDTAMLALTVDTQQTSFYYQVWALSYAPAIAAHMVAHGQVEAFADLDGLLEKTWLDGSAKEYRISSGLIDSGGTTKWGQRHSRTVEVYAWCTNHRHIRPIKGVPSRAGDLVSFKNVETYPNTNKKIPGGLNLSLLRVSLFKDDLEQRLSKEPGDPGALSFHDGIDGHFAKHYMGESKDEFGDWVHHDRHIRIDYWDCTGYLLALRHMLGLIIPRNPAAGEEKRPVKTISKPKARRW